MMASARRDLDGRLASSIDDVYSGATLEEKIHNEEMPSL